MIALSARDYLQIISRVRATANNNHEALARPFRSRQEAAKAAQILMEELNEVVNIEYRLSSIDNSLNSKFDVKDVARDLSTIGFTPMRIRWEVAERLKRSIFMERPNGDNPVLVREPNSGWGSSIILLGTSMARFKDVVQRLSHIVSNKCIVDLTTLEDGVISLALRCELKTGVLSSARVVKSASDSTMLRRGRHGLVPYEPSSPKSVQDSLQKLGFVPKGNRTYYSRKYGLQVDCTESPNYLTFIDTI